MKALSRNKLMFYVFVGVAWTALWIFYAALNHPETFYIRVLNELWRVLLLIPIHAIFFAYVVPFILRKRSGILLNLVFGIGLVIVQLILLSFGLYAWKWVGMQLDIYTQLRLVTLIPDTAFHRIMEDVTYQAQGGITSLFFFGISSLIYDNIQLKQATQRLLLEKKEAELNFLKSQTNPHFLFNTLNNIYALSKEKSDLAPESILRLSKILRFMLYETGGEFISISQEMEMIRDYITLERLRYDDTLEVTYHQDVDDARQPIPPLLLLPLVENAFKHGVSESGSEPFVQMNLSVQKQQLMFVVRNSVDSIQEENPEKEQIGLANLRRQLALLYHDHDLTVQQSQYDFLVTLRIDLASHV